MHSLLAELYQKYYYNNRLLIQQNPDILNPKDIDNFKTWGMKKIHKTISNHYITSLKSADIIKLESAKNYKEILNNSEKKRHAYGNTLFDVLAFRAIDFFTNPESLTLNPKKESLLASKRMLLSDFNTFISSWEIKSSNTNLSSGENAFTIFKSLLSFHLPDVSSKELIEVELERLKFAKYITTLPKKEKDSLYLNTLEKLTKLLIHEPEVTQFYNQIGLQKFANNDDYRAIIKMLKKIIKIHPNAYGTLLCQQLIQRIQKKELYLNTEPFISSKQNIPFRVGYRNMDSIYFKLVKLKCLKCPRIYGEVDLKAYINKTQELKTWKIDSFNPKDHKTHYTIFSLGKLPPGNYALLCSSSKLFSSEYESTIINEFQVTNISLTENLVGTSAIKLLVRDRLSGKPIKGAKIKYHFEAHYPKEYISQDSKKILFTDENGMALLKNYTNYKLGSFKLEITNKESILITRSRALAIHGQKPSEYSQSTLYTDRAIYKAGQKVYFSGLYYAAKSNLDINVVENYPIEVYAFYKGYKIFYKDTMRTDSYGVFRGAFTIPNQVDGPVSITVKNGSATSIKVTQYKRPTFYIKVITPVDSLTKNSSKLEGIIRSYSELPVKNASIKYTITYQSYENNLGWWGLGQKATLKNGEIKSNKKGCFNINFTPLKIDAFYTASIWVTDINGESKKNEFSFSITKELKKQIELKLNRFIKNYDKNIQLKVTDQKRKGLKELLQITIWPIKPEQDYFINWLWDNTIDTVFASKSEFYLVFPKRPYYKNNELENWSERKAKFYNTITTNKDGSFSLDSILNSLSPASYKMLIRGKNLKKEIFFNVFDIKEKKNTNPKSLWVENFKKKYNVGEKIKFLIGSARESNYVLIDIRQKKKLVKQQLLKLKKEQFLYTFEVKPEHQGGLHFSFISFSDNRFKKFEYPIEIPFKRKKLLISLSNFKDTITPGADNEFKLKITDYKNKPVKANITLSIFDKSLESFSLAHRLSFFPYYRNYSSISWKNNNKSYRNILDVKKNWNDFILVPPKKRTNFNWFNYFQILSQYKPRNRSPRFFNYAKSTALKEGVNNNNSNGLSAKRKNTPFPSFSNSKTATNSLILPRRNFKELAFYSSSIVTNKKGEATIKFKVPESLSTFNITGFAHTKNVLSADFNYSFVTQKPLAIIPNIPTFLVEKDTASLKFKIQNTSTDTLKINCLINFTGANNKPLNALMLLDTNIKPLVITPLSDQVIEWNICVPLEERLVTIFLNANSKKYQDAIKLPLVIRTNRQLVNSSLAFIMENKDSTFIHKKLSAGSSKNQVNHLLKLEYYPNPIWSVIEALSYSNVNKTNSLYSLLNSYFRNRLSLHLIREYSFLTKSTSNWKKSKLFKESKLKQNSFLKSIPLDETPWLKYIENSKEEKIRVAQFLDSNQIKKDYQRIVIALAEFQSPNGGFKWFPNFSENSWVTSDILSTIGLLFKENIIQHEPQLKKTWTSAIKFTDSYIAKEKLKQDTLKHPILVSNKILNAMHARSFFASEYPIRDIVSYNFFIKKLAKDWTKYSNYSQAILAATFYQLGFDKPAKIILDGLMNKSILYESGLTWKPQKGLYFNQDPIIFQSLMINLLKNYRKEDTANIKASKKWLLLQKRIQGWGNERVTNKACLALLDFNTGVASLKNSGKGKIKVGETSFNITPYKTEKTWHKKDISKNKGIIKIKRKGSNLSWGALHLQYYQDKNQVKKQSSKPLNIEKEFFLELFTDSGIYYQKLHRNSKITVGDRVLTRFIITVTEKSDFIILKNLRTGALEPVDVNSGYYQLGGVNYYKSVKEGSINYFFQSLDPGVYILKHLTKANLKGVFTSPNAVLSSYYAPEFSSHSSGITIKIVE